MKTKVGGGGFETKETSLLWEFEDVGNRRRFASGLPG